MLLFLLAAALLALQATAAAAAIPTKPLKFVVPFPAGSGTDAGARVLGQWLTAKTGQPVIVDNRPGASGLHRRAGSGRCRAGRLHRAADDQHHARRQPGDVQEAALRPGEGLRAGQHGRQRPDCCCSSRPTARTRTSARSSRSCAPAASALHFGAGNSSSRIAGELLKTATGADLLAVPYKGTPPALTDLMGRQIDFMFCDVGAGAAARDGRQAARAGRLERRSRAAAARRSHA